MTSMRMAIAVPCTGRPISRRAERRRQPQPSSARSASTKPARRSSIGTTTVPATYFIRKPTPMNRMTRPILATGLPVRSQFFAAISQRGGVDAGCGGVDGVAGAGRGGAACVAREAAAAGSASGSGASAILAATLARMGSVCHSSGAGSGAAASSGRGKASDCGSGAGVGAAAVAGSAPSAVLRCAASSALRSAATSCSSASSLRPRPAPTIQAAIKG